MALAVQLRLRLPAWIEEFAAALPECLPDEEARMRTAIELAARNVECGSGGPFGALVVAAGDGRVLGLGVNRVEAEHCSCAHAEIMALSLAQQHLGHWHLGGTALGPTELVTSCEPCAMCLGAIPWSGVSRVLCGAHKHDAERAGFDEGDRIEDWIGVLNRRRIDVVTGLLRDSAAAVLEHYANSGRPIYVP